MRYFIFLLALACNYAVQSKPTKPHKFLNNDPMLMEDLFEGDIMFPDNPAYPNERSVGIATNLWPNGIIPYVIDSASNYTSSDISVILAGMQMVESQTNADGNQYVKFVPYTNEETYLRIFSGSGCWSYVGRVFNGRQDLSLLKPVPGSGHCVFKGIVAHELMHAMGIFHEQSRTDRDNFVRIAYENIITGYEHNFDIKPSSSFLGTSYDLLSVMHYESKAFSSNGLPTVIPLNSTVNLVNAAYKNTITNSDVAGIRFLYGRFLPSTTTSTTTTKTPTSSTTTSTTLSPTTTTTTKTTKRRRKGN